MNVCKCQLHIKPRQPIILPHYKGSTLRGGFGNAFKKVVCILKNKECSDCILKGQCVYSYVFETPHVGKGATFGPGRYEIRL